MNAYLNGEINQSFIHMEMGKLGLVIPTGHRKNMKFVMWLSKYLIKQFLPLLSIYWVLSPGLLQGKKNSGLIITVGAQYATGE